MKSDTLLIETSWEVCNKVGGIYTVIRTKCATAVQTFGHNYCAIGPLVDSTLKNEFEEFEPDCSIYSNVVEKIRERGIEVMYGKWLVSGSPTAILLNPNSIRHKIDELKYQFWKDHHVEFPAGDLLLDDVLLFTELQNIFFGLLTEEVDNQKIIAHFHEWMSGFSIANIRKADLPIKIVFTTHATILGRYLAMNDANFYNRLPYYNWEESSKRFGINAQVKLERAAAHGAHVLTTVSRVTAEECKHLLGRNPDIILPNGVNSKKYEPQHEFQNLHEKYKEKIHQFTMSHFFPNYGFDLDNTLYFFTAGRNEFRNKGFDVTLKALKNLNNKLKEEKSDKTVVMFFITPAPFHSINADVLEKRAQLHEIKNTVHEIQEQISNKLFHAAAHPDNHKLPCLNDFVDDYWKLQYRRSSQTLVSDKLPYITTHNLKDDTNDSILNSLREYQLLNYEEDRVKVVYHPDFIKITNPLFGLDYTQFVRGAHLGIFPSFYEPFGMTPVECLARAVPAITSNLSGFGNFVENDMTNIDPRAIDVIDNKNSDFDTVVKDLVQSMYHFTQLTRHERIELKNKSEATSNYFDWNNLYSYYIEAYQKCMEII